MMNEAGPPLKQLLVVYHSHTGATEQAARALASGAGSEENVVVLVRHALEAGTDDVLTSDALVFATPENLGSMSGLLKDFFDRTYYPVFDRINGLPYAMLICAGSDGSGAARQITRIATGWRLRAVAEPLIICTHAQTPEEILAPKRLLAEDIKKCQELGAAMAAAIRLGIY